MPKMQSFVEECLKGAAREIERAKTEGLSIKAKGRNDMATSADFAAEKLIVGKIRKEFPDSAVLSEESYTEAQLAHPSLFVIDPIDGTHNFIQGIPIYGVSIAHFSEGRPTAGGIYMIPQKLLFYAEKGKQSTLNGRKISVSKKGRLEDFFMFCDSRIHLAKEQGKMDAVLELEKMSQHTRFVGSAIYDMGYVACGMIDASIDFKLKPYDFAAAAFIAEQAGATVTDFEGKGWDLATKKFVTSNGLQHKRLLEILNKR
ncbi:MAG: inositol monophosphatase [Candidatus Micrarchaeota archaeon]|nr:inositol monophosphatase [Candidatus Micrarchaeota archaeon]